MPCDAVIVGGSVAGSITAIELARRGFRVALFEKCRFPRPKACGEGLLPHGVAALAELGIDCPAPRVRGLRYVSPGGRVAEADFPFGYGLVVRRERFDEVLFRKAASTPGVEAFEGTAWDPDRTKARWIVGADGLHSRFHRGGNFTARSPAGIRIGLSTHVRGLRIDRERVEVILHPGGEVYLAPSDGDETLVACLCRKESIPAAESNEARVKAILRSLPSLVGRLGEIRFTTPALAVAPLGLAVTPVASGNIMLVGDAAGAPDPVTGEGMSLAILSARAAARAMAEGRPEEYARERERLAAGSLWLGSWILRASRLPAIADRVVRSLAGRPDLFRKLLDVAVGRERNLSLPELARLVI
ncbi:MAG: NAD(P)/FAD-dependent oxidoreductase [Planctomycetes bacterium]|nr:NAD(P)/FAD-dependent oxidoreductase [Planctomycetota bacterium]